MEMLTQLEGTIIGYGATGGSLFMALLALILKLIRMRIKTQRYRRVKEGLKAIEDRIKEENRGGTEALRERIKEASNQLNSIADQL